MTATAPIADVLGGTDDSDDTVEAASEATWDDVLSTALVGTGRRRLHVRVGGSAGWAHETAEADVLAAAAVLGAERRAGVRPASAVSVPEPAPPDDRPPAGAGAVQVLELLLLNQIPVPGGPRPLIGEWLAQSATAGRRPPHRLLPALLDLGRVDRSLRDAVLAAGGTRAAWLAAQHDELTWAAPVSGDDGKVWSLGRPEERVEVLRRRRAESPDAGIELLATTWSSETAADRATFVDALAAHLTPGDETFLDAALDDRSGKVRAAAARLLDSMPTSARAQRMAERSLPLVAIGGGRRPHLSFDLPAGVDAAARRDGVVDKDAPARTGRRAWWFIQLVRGTPLGAWERHLGHPPAELVRLAATHAELIEGWSAAAVRQRDATWADALFAQRPSADLLAAVDAPHAQRLVTAALPRATETLTLGLLAALDGPWSDVTSRAVVDRLADIAMSPQRLQQVLPILATRLDPTVADDVARWATERAGSEAAARLVRSLHHALSLRLTIVRELT